MDKLSPSKLLQMHGIEVSMDDPRTTEEIAQHYIDVGFISVVIESALPTTESTV